MWVCQWLLLLQKNKVIGFDLNEQRITELKNSYDRTGEIETKVLESSCIDFTSDPMELQRAKFHIVAVPTPIDKHKKPDMSYVYKASEIVAQNLVKGSIVIYESTVYPGATEEECVPILEKISNLKYKKDFFVAYSPERINPSDKEHTFTKIKKVVSACDSKSLDCVSELYASVVLAGVHRAPSIKVAEAAKVIENTQRDINIAFVNELSVLFHKLKIDTQSVLEAASTKWNFLNFKPGLVGGHCIGVDPYYMTYKAQECGYHPEIILAGRKINDYMGSYIAQETMKLAIKNRIDLSSCTVNIIGLTFKENCSDIRNTKVYDIVKYFLDMNIDVKIYDPIAIASEVKELFGFSPQPLKELASSSINILAVPHQSLMGEKDRIVGSLLENGIFIDIKGAFDSACLVQDSQVYWSL